MRYYLIENLNPNGQAHCDYKGLDIDLFVAGSQFYDFENNRCIIATSEEKPSTEELYSINETEYTTIKNAIIAKQAKQTDNSLDGYQRISDLEMAIAAILGGAE